MRGVWSLSVTLWCALMWCGVSSSVMAQERSQAVDEAEEALARGDDASALRLYEKAYLDTKDGYYIYQRIALYERRGEYGRALGLLEEQRAELLASEHVHDLALVETRLQGLERAVSAPLVDRELPSIGRSRVGVLAVVAGGALLLGGGVVWGLALRQGRSLQCEEAAGCHGGGMNQAEWDARWRQVRVKEGLGWGLGALGVAGLGFGVYRTTRERETRATITLQPEVAPGQGAALSFRVIF